MKIIFLNGPPYCGKDTIGEKLHEYLGDVVHRYKISRPIKDAVIGFLGLDEEWLEAHKDEEIPGIGVSYRKLQQDFSEKYAKPLYGRDIFGRIAALRIQKAIDCPWDFAYTVITDSGFNEEVAPISDMVGRDNCMIVRIHRKGTSFDGDTREWVQIDGIRSVGIKNDGTPDDALHAILDSMQWANLELR